MICALTASCGGGLTPALAVDLLYSKRKAFTKYLRGRKGDGEGAGMPKERKSRTIMWHGIPVFSSGPGTRVGLIASGDFAVGLVAGGRFSVGLLASGAVALGIVASGAVAVGLLRASGAVAFGTRAAGAVAIGKKARGAIAVGRDASGALAYHVKEGWVISDRA